MKGPHVSRNSCVQDWIGLFLDHFVLSLDFAEPSLALVEASLALAEEAAAGIIISCTSQTRQTSDIWHKLPIKPFK